MFSSVNATFDALAYSYACPPSMHNVLSRGERELWCAVIEQAFIDAGLIRDPRGVHLDSVSSEDTLNVRSYRTEAMRWLLGDSSDFYRVCVFAGVHPSVVKMAAQQSLPSAVTS